MYISRDDFDQQPLFVKQGALQLWGVLLAKRIDLCRVRELYSFNDFYAELCYHLETGEPTCVCSFTRLERLNVYPRKINIDGPTRKNE